MEVSLVTFPANDKARVSDVKAVIEDFSAISDVETYLRDAGGFSRGEAKALVARIKAIGPRDAGDGLVDIAASIIRNTNSIRS